MRGVKLPVGVSAFANEIYQAPESWAERAYPKLVHYARHATGTHFAAWEQPALFVSDVRATFRTLVRPRNLRRRMSALRPHLASVLAEKAMSRGQDKSARAN